MWGLHFVQVPSSAVPLEPIPVPTDHFTLPQIKSAEDYLQTQDVLLFWLRSPGFSTARSDDLLLTDARNALASQFWEGRLQAAIKDDPTCFLFENTGSTFYGKGFEMIQILKDHFCPSSISNSFTTLLALFNDMQGNKESIHLRGTWARSLVLWAFPPWHALSLSRSSLPVCVQA